MSESHRRYVVQSTDERLVDANQCRGRHHSDDGATRKRSRAYDAALERATHGDVSFNREGDDQPHGNKSECVGGVQEQVTHSGRVDPRQATIRRRPARQAVVEPVQPHVADQHERVRHGQSGQVETCGHLADGRRTEHAQ